MRFIFTLLLGFLSLSLISILAVEKIDVPLNLSIFFMSIAMPSVAFYVIVDDNKMHYSGSSNIYKFKMCTMITGILFGIAAIAAIFFHFNIYSGIIYTF